MQGCDENIFSPSVAGGAACIMAYSGRSLCPDSSRRVKYIIKSGAQFERHKDPVLRLRFDEDYGWVTS